MRFFMAIITLIFINFLIQSPVIAQEDFEEEPASEEAEEEYYGEGPDEGDYEEPAEEPDEPPVVSRGGARKRNASRFSGPGTSTRDRSENRVVRGRNTFSEPSKVNFTRSGQRLEVREMSFEERKKALIEERNRALEAFK